VPIFSQLPAPDLSDLAVDFIAIARTPLDLSWLAAGSYSLELRRRRFAAGYFEVRAE